MNITEHKKEGVFERELTDTEINNLAALGNKEAKREVLKRNWATMTAAQKIEAIKDVL